VPPESAHIVEQLLLSWIGGGCTRHSEASNV
jgi:hypothetical protein